MSSAGARRIVLGTVGTRGDVQPMLALGTALRACGHRVTMAVPPNFLGACAGHGLDAAPLGRDMLALAQDAARAHAGHPLALLQAVTAAFRRELAAQVATLLEVARGADLLVGASLLFGASSTAEALGIPYRYAAFFPQLLCPRELPPPLARHHGLPAWLNRALWWAQGAATNLTLLPSLNAARRGVGLAPAQAVWPTLVGARPLLAADPVLAPLPASLRASTIQTGAWLLDDDTPLSFEVERFLGAGPPPIYVGFGSMPAADPSASLALLVRAARRVGRRLVVSAGWSKVGAGAHEDDVLCVDDVAHARLFPRVACVVHHGGAGTTMAAARAGVPQLLVPHLLDQFYWARRVQALGIGPAPIRHRTLREETLVRGLAACLAEPAFRERARALEPRLTSDGAARAARLLTASWQ